MDASEKRPPFQSSWATWSIFALLGLSAALCGLFLPQSLRNLREPVVSVPAPDPEPQKKDTLEYTPPPLPEMPSLGPMFLRLTLGTIVVLILCTVTLLAGKRWLRPLSTPLHENRQLRVLESLVLTGRCSMYLLQAGETKVLVGLDHAGIKSLLPLPQPFENALEELNEKAPGRRLIVSDY